MVRFVCRIIVIVESTNFYELTGNLKTREFAEFYNTQRYKIPEVEYSLYFQ